MYSRNWPVLLVDDEPDVLSVSKLALRKVKVHGLPLEIHTANSKAEAIELLQTKLMLPNGLCHVAVAFVDVVMETDQAGLELCQFIREELKSDTVQLYVRTGQPGIAPERSVVDRYDISGYFTKHETTEDKLYSLVKSGVRHWYTLLFGAFVTQSLYALATTARSHEAIKQLLAYSLQGAQDDGSISQAVFLDGSSALLWGTKEAEALELKEKLDAQPGIPMGEGDKVVVDGNHLLIKIGATPDSSETYVVSRGTAPSPNIEHQLFHQFFKTLAHVWKQSA